MGERASHGQSEQGEVLEETEEGSIDSLNSVPKSLRSPAVWQTLGKAIGEEGLRVLRDRP